MIKLIVTDLDGTFLNSQGDYDRQGYAAIYQLMAQQGIHFAACTGKQCERVEELFGRYSQNLWIVGNSATSIKYNGQFSYRSFIANALGQQIIRTLKQTNPHQVLIACTADGAVIEQSVPPRLKQTVRGSYTNMIEVNDFATLTTDFVKITVYDETGHCPQTRPYLTPFEQHCYIVVSEAAWLDITDYGVHKGATIHRLQALLNVGRHETMAFGDGYNDIELLEQAEYSFAMRNACAATQAAANFIIGSNDDNAVQQTIVRLLALQA